MALLDGVLYGATTSARNGVSITVNTANRPRCRGVWVGTAQSYDFSFDGTNWILFQGVAAGSLLPLQVVGARINSGSAAPSAGDIVFLY